MKYVTQIGNRDILLPIITLQLKNNGIKVAKSRKILTKQENKVTGKIFGSAISHLPSVVADLDKQITIPTFLASVTSALEKDIKAEGLFRKTGSLARQRELRKCIEKGQMNFQSANAFDLTSLIKQFLRELPEPLISSRLHDSFIKAQNLDNAQKRLENLLLLCLLLPIDHLNVFRFIMMFLMRAASHSDLNKMDVRNLAVVMTPNLMQSQDKIDKGNKILQSQTDIVITLMIHANEIGMVPDYIMDKLTSKSCELSEDELEKSSGSGQLLDSAKAKKHSRRSLNGVFSSLRRRVGRPVINEYNDCSVQLSVFNCVDVTPNVEKERETLERSSSKRKAERDSSITPPMKKRATLADSCETSFYTPNTRGGFHRNNQSYLDSVQNSSNTIFSVGTPSFNFTNGDITDKIFTSCDKESKEFFKTPKSKPKYKRFFSPGRLIRRRNNPSLTVSPLQTSKLQLPNKNKLEDLGVNKVPEKTKEKTKIVDESSSAQPILTLAPVFPPFSKLPDVVNSSKTPSEIKPDNITKKTKTEADVKNTYELRSRRSLTDSDIAKRFLDSVRIPTDNAVSKKDIRKSGSFSTQSTVNRDRSVKRADSARSSRQISRPPLKGSLRRGRPNTVRTGLPMASPYKYPINTDLSEVAIHQISPIPIALDFGPEDITSDKEIATPNTTEMKCQPMVVIDDEKSSSEHPFNYTVNSTEIDKSQDPERIYHRNPEDTLDDFGKLLIAEIARRNSVKSNGKPHVNKKSNHDETSSNKTRDDDEKKPLRRNTRRSTRLSLSHSNITDVTSSSACRQLSGSDISQHKGVVIAPLTNATSSILSHVGILENDGSQHTVESMDVEPSWRPASTVIAKDPKEVVVPSYGRPSLLVLKKERAGMVSASVQKYNSFNQSSNKGPTITRSAERAQSKTVAANANSVIRTSSRSITSESNHSEASIPMTKYVLRQSLRLSKNFPRSNSFSSTPNTPASCPSSRSSTLRPSVSASSLDTKSPLRDGFPKQTPKSIFTKPPHAGIKTKPPTPTSTTSIEKKQPTRASPRHNHQTPLKWRR